MSELLQVFLTSALTIIVGVSLYVLGEIIKITYINPWQKFNQVIAKIDNELKYYAYLIANPGVKNQQSEIDYLKCSRRMRKLSCDIETSYKQLPKILKNKYPISKIIDSAQILMGISNGLFHKETAVLHNHAVKKIRENLNITSITG